MERGKHEESDSEGCGDASITDDELDSVFGVISVDKVKKIWRNREMDHCRTNLDLRSSTLIKSRPDEFNSQEIHVR
jgi:hypothetical protein